MKPLTERDIRASFVNCSKGDAERLNLPADLAERPWEDLDFLGWRDPGAPERAYLVVERDGARGGLIGVALRAASSAGRGFTARSMCSVCLSARAGGDVCLMTARRTGDAGRLGNSVGQYLCANLDCSLVLRGKKDAVVGADLDEYLAVDEKVARAMANLDAFLERITR